VLALLTPDAMVARVVDVSLEMLRAWEVSGIALDLDNTIVPWHTSQVAPDIAAWVAAVRGGGVRFCLLTNNYAPHVRAVGTALDMPVVRGALKPLPSAYAATLRQLGTRPSQTLAIGDQLFTDVLGAKAAGMRAVLVRPLSNREFPTTRLLRLFERPVYAALLRSPPGAGTPGRPT
jgi:HAD superfamily phosphatase (TIGR01668 family)